MRLRTFLVFTLLLVLLFGCAGPSMSPQERAALERPARALEARGEWREAATVWQQTSQTLAGEIAFELQLNAADALLQAGDGIGAAQIARALPQSMPSALSIRRALILADAALQTGDPMDALQRVGPALTTTDPLVQARYRRIRADALEMGGDLIGASRERSLRDPLLGGSEERYRNHQRIWNLLAKVPVHQLETLPLQPDSTHNGWLELAAIARRNALDVDQLDGAINEWSNRYPGHPAGEAIVPEIVELARTEAQAPGKVALLLPQTGRFSSVAAAIRDGFMAAWYADAPNEYRPEIVMIDTNGRDPALAYSDAINDGAQFVVGPLAKESVSAVIDGAALDVTTLALNYPLSTAVSSNPDAGAEQGQITAQNTLSAPAAASTNTQSATRPVIAPQPIEHTLQANTNVSSSSGIRNLQRVYYFVLSPEDEARRAAEYAYERGARQAAVLSAAGPWGERVGDAFAQRWRGLGGVLVTSTPFPEEAQGLSGAVERLLNIDRSKARAKQLRSVLVREIKHEPQPRRDIDVIFMAAFPQAARQLRPLLQFHRAERVPILATSHVYDGIVDPQANQDLNGVMFADMPWLMTPNAHSLPAQARSLWPDAGGAPGRLYAFGADAYTLIAKLRELRANNNSAYPGLTGKLSLDSQQHVRRDMQWSHFVEGVAQPVDEAMPSATWSVAGR